MLRSVIFLDYWYLISLPLYDIWGHNLLSENFLIFIQVCYVTFLLLFSSQHLLIWLVHYFSGVLLHFQIFHDWLVIFYCWDLPQTGRLRLDDISRKETVLLDVRKNFIFIWCLGWRIHVLTPIAAGRARECTGSGSCGQAAWGEKSPAPPLPGHLLGFLHGARPGWPGGGVASH